jgi:hypothetical protein
MLPVGVFIKIISIIELPFGSYIKKISKTSLRKGLNKKL